jgi:ankyrin repeat protein
MSNGDAVAVELLLTRNAQSQPNDGRHYPIHYAASKNHVDCSDLLIRHAPNDDRETLKQLLLCRDGNGMTPVLRAATKGQLRWLQWYHKVTADTTGNIETWWLSQQDREGNNMLHLVIEQEYWDVLKWLCETLDDTIISTWSSQKNREDKLPSDLGSSKAMAHLLQQLGVLDVKQQ